MLVGATNPQSGDRQFPAQDRSALGTGQDAAVAGERGHEIHTRPQQADDLEPFELLATLGAGGQILEREFGLAVSNDLFFHQLDVGGRSSDL